MGIVVLSSSGHATAEASEPVGTPTTQIASAPAVSSGSITSEKNEVQLQEDGTVADALQRRPDLKFGNVTVDGEKSSVSLSSMSSAAVDSVEVLKAVTPDRDADSEGGSVSVRSKPAFEQTRRTFQGRLVFKYDSDLEEVDTEGTLTAGDAFGPDRNWGALFTVRGEQDFGGSDNRGIDWMSLETSDGEVRVMERLRLDQWNDENIVTELNGVIDHRINDQLSFYLRGNYATEDRTAYNPQLDLRFAEGQFTEVSDSGATIQDAQVKRNLVAFESTDEEWSAALGGYFVTEAIDGDFRLYYENSDYLEPDFFVIDFEQAAVDLVYDLTDRNFPEFRQTGGDTLYDSGSFVFDEMVSEVWSHQDSELIGTLNLKVAHGWGEPDTGYWKIGGKVRLREVDQRSDSLLHDQFQGDYRQIDVLGDYRDATFFQGRYRLDPAIGWPEAPDYRDAHQDQFVLNESRTRENSDPSTYDARERITAGYAAVNHESGPIRFLAGARYEQTDVDYTGREVIIDESGQYESTQILTGTTGYGNFFPGIHGRYRANDWLTVIGSWTETINRPDYRDLVPYRFVDRENREVEEGNPELKPTLFTNFDLAFDFRTMGSGRVSLELFSKNVGDFFYRQESIVEDGPYTGYDRFRLENGPSASIKGMQLTWTQSMGFFAPWLEALSFNLNTVWRRTSIEYPPRPDEDLPLARLPDQEVTLTVFYEKAWFFGQVELTHESDSLEQVGENPSDDRYSQGSTRLNIDTTCELIKGVKLIAELHNVTSAPDEIRYEYDPRYPTYLRNEGWEATLGLRWDL